MRSFYYVRACHACGHLAVVISVQQCRNSLSLVYPTVSYGGLYTTFSFLTFHSFLGIHMGENGSHLGEKVENPRGAGSLVIV